MPQQPPRNHYATAAFNPFVIRIRVVVTYFSLFMDLYRVRHGVDHLWYCPYRKQGVLVVHVPRYHFIRGAFILCTTMVPVIVTGTKNGARMALVC